MRRIVWLLLGTMAACTAAPSSTNAVRWQDGTEASSEPRSWAPIHWGPPGCRDVAGQRVIRVASVGQVADEPAVIERLSMGMHDRWPHRPVAVERGRAPIELPDGDLVIATMTGSVEPGIVHCLLPSGPYDPYEHLVCTRAYDPTPFMPLLLTGHEAGSYAVALFDGAVRVFDDLEALAQCLPTGTLPDPEPGGRMIVVERPTALFVEQIPLGSGQQQLVLVEADDQHSLRRTEVFTW